MSSIFDQIDALIDSLDFGTASASKRGRNPKFPYVPIIKHTDHIGIEKTANPTRREAFETREKAIARAQAIIDAQREHMRSCLKQPRYRAWRKQHGLPEEI